ncbi:MAG: hypothetical protein AAGG51_02710 [Cyanobacteria bacterium P01_G01_bin.54]
MASSHFTQTQPVQTVQANSAVRYQGTPDVDGAWLDPRDPLTLLSVAVVFGFTVAIAAIKS